MVFPGRSPAPAPPRRDPRTTLSVGRARAKSMVAGLGKTIRAVIPMFGIIDIKHLSNFYVNLFTGFNWKLTKTMLRYWLTVCRFRKRW